MHFKPGDEIIVKVGGLTYVTIIDAKGVQRFKENKLISHLIDTICPSDIMNLLPHAFWGEKFSQREFAEFYMSIGYSVSGFGELSFFEDMDIENPLWENQDEKALA